MAARPLLNAPAYPAPSNKAYAGNLSKMIHLLDRGTDWLQHSPRAKADVAARLKHWASINGVDLSTDLPATSTVVTDDQSAQATDGATVVNATIKVAAGNVTGIVLPAGSLVVSP